MLNNAGNDGLILFPKMFSNERDIIRELLTLLKGQFGFSYTVNVGTFTDVVTEYFEE